MFSDLKKTNGIPDPLPVENLENALSSADAVHVLSSGIYYVDNSTANSLTINGGDNKKKNGIAVAKNATAYIYIPANFTLTVYGGNGTGALRANGGSAKMPVFAWIEHVPTLDIYKPSTLEDSLAGAPGQHAAGGGAAIYVPESANLVILGSGKLVAQGGNGGIASQGAQGMDTVFSFVSAAQNNKALLTSPEPHVTTNNPHWKMNIRDTGYNGPRLLGEFVAQAGAGGTGGNGAGGGGAAIGTDGAEGAEGSSGAETPMIQIVHGKIYTGDTVAPLKTGVKVSPSQAKTAGNIYIADAIRNNISATPGEGGDAWTVSEDETWTNGLNISDTTPKYTVKAASHYTSTGEGKTFDENNFIHIYVTNARRGGNGGAGGKGVAIGSGGEGGAGGTGGDSGSVVTDMRTGYSTYYSDTLPNYQLGPGADGADGKNGTEVQDTTLDSDDLPYNTITFAGVNDANPEKYYLQNSRDITVPNYTPASTSTEFKGWKVTQAATELPKAFGETVHANAQKLLTATENAVCQPDETITTAGFYGNVVLEPVLVQKTFAITKGGYVETVSADNAYETQSVTVTAENREDDGWELTGFTVSNAEDPTAAEQHVDPNSDNITGTFNMPGYAVKVKANYKKKNYSVSVTDGELTVTDDEGNTGTETTSTTAQVENKITFTADPALTDRYFARWEFTSDGQPVDMTAYVLDGALNEPTVKIKMPPQNLTAKAVFLEIVKNDIKFDGECGFARVDGKRVTAAKSGDTVTITAAAQDEMLFDHWEMFSGTDPDAADWQDITDQLASKTSAETTFRMPNYAVTLKAHYRPVEPDEPDHSDTTTISAGKSAAIGAAAAVGAGIVVWQGSELAMRIYRNKTIQIDYWPGNRIALAQLIWSRAGSPEPESDVPFADITEALDTLNDTNINAQKAARWCVEQGLLDAKTADDGTESFEPMKHVTHLRVCLTWQNARKMGLFEVPAEPEA